MDFRNSGGNITEGRKEIDSENIIFSIDLNYANFITLKLAHF